MREIKFRTWNSKVKKMWSHELIKRNTGFALSSGLSKDDFLLIPTQEKHILMQYTGLKDKHGKEIYEGDIVKWNNRLHPQEKRVIEFSFGSFYFGSGCICFFDPEHFEIIGNIYENPDLLA